MNVPVEYDDDVSGGIRSVTRAQCEMEQNGHLCDGIQVKSREMVFQFSVKSNYVWREIQLKMRDFKR